jgi:anti-anti-sigma factor
MIGTRTIEANIENDALTVTCTGDLDLHIADKLRIALDEARESKSATVDFRSVSYIDTAIAAVLIGAARTLRNTDHPLKVIVTNGSHPQYVLRIMGLAALMDVEVVESASE